MRYDPLDSALRPSQRRRCIALLGWVLLVALSSADARASDKPADLVLVDGKIVTLDEANPQAQAVAVRGDRIVSVGDDRQMQDWIGDRTRVIPLAGKLAVKVSDTEEVTEEVRDGIDGLDVDQEDVGTPVLPTARARRCGSTPPRRAPSAGGPARPRR